MKLFDLIKVKLFKEPPPLLDYVRDKEWYENGQKKSEVTFKDGKINGLVTYWYENGEKKSEGTYKNGKKDGLFTWWYGNGKKEYEGTYKNGKKFSVKEWNEDGSIKE